ncbi:LysR substrate-binding domain-containing protein [Mesorhizobium sp. YR577]|jgi:DNA-binding transcriptional LysR family regulator|uniref:LysR substrate-binding domain-containing protein n=1 Tax=Mesorhizobium sp. YR577 TaxID=1884373 RepID=UPI0008E0E317|nr:LysR substrate-binding domain-containing protein [Mesorhizobium sp. YR577]SFT78827.1 transcriptional regulator, LysR family [Mesorhizobium sp. YR577]
MNSAWLRLPPLSSLRAFVAVGATGSIRKAGAMLNVDHSAVSRHINCLEAQLGVSLLAPEGRGITLTPDGKLYFERVSKGFEILGDATADIFGSQSKSLTISAPPALAHRVLLPRIPELELLLPDWDVKLTTGEEEGRGEVEGPNTVSITFQSAATISTSIHSERIAHPRILPLASAKASATWPSIKSASDLFQVPLIQQASNGYWIRWFAALGVRELPALRGPNLPNTLLALEAARRGQGVALVNETIAADLIRDGELVVLFETEVRLAGYYLNTPKSIYGRNSALQLRKWIKNIAL